MSKNTEHKDKKRKLGAASFVGGSALGALGVYLDSASNRYLKPKEKVEKAQEYLDKVLERHSLSSKKDLKPKADNLKKAIQKVKNAKDLTEFEKSFAGMYEGSLKDINKAIEASKYITEHNTGQMMKETGKVLKHGGPSTAILGGALYLLNQDKDTKR